MLQPVRHYQTFAFVLIALCLVFSLPSCAKAKVEMDSIDGQALFERVESLPHEERNVFVNTFSERELIATGSAAVRATNNWEYAVSFLVALHEQYWKENTPDAEAVFYYLESSDPNISELWVSMLTTAMESYINDWSQSEKRRLIKGISNKLFNPNLSALDKDFYIRGISRVAYATLPPVNEESKKLKPDELEYVKKIEAILAPIIIEKKKLLQTLVVDSERMGGMYGGLVGSLTNDKEFFINNPSYTKQLPDLYASLHDVYPIMIQVLNEKKTFEKISRILSGLLIQHRNYPELDYEFLEAFVDEISSDERFVNEEDFKGYVSNWKYRIEIIKERNNKLDK